MREVIMKHLETVSSIHGLASTGFLTGFVACNCAGNVSILAVTGHLEAQPLAYAQDTRESQD